MHDASLRVAAEAWSLDMSTSYDFKDLQRRMDGAISAFKSDLASLRTGRASSNLLDPIMVSAYGSQMPINQVANVTVPEPRMMSGGTDGSASRSASASASGHWLPSKVNITAMG